MFALGLLVLTRQLVILREMRGLLVQQRRQDARFRALVQRSGDALMIVGSDGHVSYRSPTFARTFSIADEREAGHDLFALLEPDDHDALRQLLGAPSSHDAAPTITVRLRTATPIWVELVASDHTTDPDIAGIVLNARDVTERRRLQAQLTQAEKLEAVGRLAGGVAHDFNYMLTAILGYTELVERGMRNGTAELDDVLEIRRASVRAAELTRQLMAFGRRQMVAPRQLSVDEIVRSMERMLRRLVSGSVELTTLLDSDGCPVLADPAQIEQVVLNLALNARDAMPNGGPLLSEPTRVAFRDGGRPGTSGGGMSAAAMHRLFEPFFTTKLDGAGTGVGLATVYGIVKQTRGYLGVDSGVGTGTIFTVYLPCAVSIDGCGQVAAQRQAATRGSPVARA